MTKSIATSTSLHDEAINVDPEWPSSALKPQWPCLRLFSFDVVRSRDSRGCSIRFGHVLMSFHNECSMQMRGDSKLVSSTSIMPIALVLENSPFLRIIIRALTRSRFVRGVGRSQLIILVSDWNRCVTGRSVEDGQW